MKLASNGLQFDYVTIGSPLFRLLDANPIELRVQVPERRMAGVAVGGVAMRLDAMIDRIQTTAA